MGMFQQPSKPSSNGVLKFVCRAIPPNSNRLRRNFFVGCRAVEIAKLLNICPSLGLSSQQGLPRVCTCYKGLLDGLRLHRRNFDDRLASLYNYEGETDIDAPYDGEILCIETDGLASTVWRFAHNRAVWTEPYFNTQPLGNMTADGRYFLFTSGWDARLGNNHSGQPGSDVWIVKLD
jgi:hypothetical protein